MQNRKATDKISIVPNLNYSIVGNSWLLLILLAFEHCIGHCACVSIDPIDSVPWIGNNATCAADPSCAAHSFSISKN